MSMVCDSKKDNVPKLSIATGIDLVIRKEQDLSVEIPQPGTIPVVLFFSNYKNIFLKQYSVSDHHLFKLLSDTFDIK